MIRMIQSRSARHAKEYFLDALAKSDYYVSDQELPGLWQGRLAERLGLSGETAKDDFFALCENRHPRTGKKLTPRVKKDRTPGYDINFHCPKSVSVLHALSSDDHILSAFRDSVTETMRLIEADSQTRVRTDGRDENRKTGELVWAHFVHQTARPVKGMLPDPHLHSHCYTFNATWDPVEERFKAAQFREINRDMPFYQAHFHKVLSDKLADLGYVIRKTDKSFEIGGVPQRVINLFSKRTDEIGRIAKEKGITDPKERSELGAKTRGKKQKGASMDELRQEWRSQIAALGPVPGEADATVRVVRDKTPSININDTPGKASSDVAAQQCVDYALLHEFERRSVVDARRLLMTALNRSVGLPEVSAASVGRCFAEDKRIIHVQEKGQPLCTTKEVLAEERRMVELAKAGQGQMVPLYKTAPDISLMGEHQRRAVEHVLTTSHRVSIIRGVAGAGKTTLMKEAVEHIEQAGKTVIPVAPTAQASRGVLKESGFEGATTVAHLLADTAMQARLRNQVLWVDEAGLLGTKDMKSLLELTTRQNARLILSGDTRQHASVVRGDALRILNTVAGIPVAEVSKIYRQASAQYRDAVKDLSQGDVARAFEKLENMGCIKEANTSALVKDYIDVVKRGKSALVISPTHAQGEKVTEEIRDGLREQGLLGKKEIEAARLRNLNLTEAEKSDPRQFSPGQIVQFTQNAPGIRRGSVWTVAQTTATEVKLANRDGEARPLPTGKSDRYEVFELDTIRLAKGDKIRITKNGFDDDKKRLNNGDILTVASVSKRGKIALRNETSKATHTIDTRFGHLAHAHCITSHAAQGKTVDEVFIFQPAETFAATDAKQVYVSVSRGRDRAHIYTDSKEALLHHAKDLRERQSALELVGEDKKRDAILRQIQAGRDTGQLRELNQRTREHDHEPEI